MNLNSPLRFWLFVCACLTLAFGAAWIYKKNPEFQPKQVFADMKAAEDVEVARRGPVHAFLWEQYQTCRSENKSGPIRECASRAAQTAKARGIGDGAAIEAAAKELGL